MTATGWHPVALSRDIEPGTSAGTVLQGAEIALWRDNSGAIHAWEDRCPHRGMKLSFGFVRGDHIACLYHGWEYGPDGRCRKIPAHPALEVPASICVKTYKVAETGGMVLVSFNDDLPPAPQTEPFAPLRSLFLDCPLDDAVALLQSPDNPLVGKSHFAFSEANIAFSETRFSLRIGLQRCRPDTSALHITVGGKPSVAERMAMMDRALVFRLLAERVPA